MTDFTLGLDEAAKILNAENNIVPRTDQNMNPTAAIIVMFMLSLTISSMGFFPFASAFVNIVSPSKGEAVPAGSTLTISGTSDDNAQTNCNIQIIVNDNRPCIKIQSPSDQETIQNGPLY
jgi:hypothetical protein